jgi:plastocyanin
MREIRFIAWVGAAFATGIVAGCQVADVSGSAPRAAREFKVGMLGSAYSPARIEARIGDTIRFVNDDQADHTVYVPTFGHGINLGGQKPGSEAVMALGKAGSFRVECVNHVDMLINVTVAP